MKTDQQLRGERVTVLGYDEMARDHALALHRAGTKVAIGLPPQAASWARACADGFLPVATTSAVEDATIVVCVHDEDPAFLRELGLAPGTLVVLGHGLAIETSSIELRGFDVAVVTRMHRGGECRVAVHRDVTGRALVRAMAFARAAFGQVSVEISTVGTEVDFELAVMERPGSVLALLGASHHDEVDEDATTSEWPSFASLPERSRP